MPWIVNKLCSAEMWPWLWLPVGMIMCLAVGVEEYGFATYALLIKDMFKLSQTKAELCSAMIYIGQLIGFFYNPLERKYGPCCVGAIYLITVTSSYGLLYIATWTVLFHQKYPDVILVYFFIKGIFTVFCLLLASSLACNHFKKTQHGLIFGIVQFSTYMASPLSALFLDGTDSPEKKVQSFMLLLLISSTVTAIALQILLGIMPKPEEENSSLVNTEQPTKVVNKTFQDVMKDSNFHLILWSFSISHGISFGVINNLTTILASLKKIYLYRSFSVTLHAVATVFMVIVSCMSDRTLKYCSPVVYLLMLCLIPGICTLAAVIWVEYTAALALMEFTTYSACGVRYGLVCALLHKEYGPSYHTHYLMLLIVGQTIVVFIFQTIFGFLYEKNIDGDSRNCVGPDCVTDSLVIAGVLQLISAVLIGGEMINQCRKEMKDNES